MKTTKSLFSFRKLSHLLCINLMCSLVVIGYVLLVLLNVDNACVAPQKAVCYFSLAAFYFVFERHMFFLGILLSFERNMFNVHRTLFKNHFGCYSAFSYHYTSYRTFGQHKSNQQHHNKRR